VPRKRGRSWGVGMGAWPCEWKGNANMTVLDIIRLGKGDGSYPSTKKIE